MKDLDLSLELLHLIGRSADNYHASSGIIRAYWKEVNKFYCRIWNTVFGRMHYKNHIDLFHLGYWHIWVWIGDFQLFEEYVGFGIDTEPDRVAIRFGWFLLVIDKDWEIYYGK